jgi:hypothetical protein
MRPTRLSLMAIALILCSQSANATIKLFCEPWNGGNQVRCEARKTDGDTPEQFHLDFTNTASYPMYIAISRWRSLCGWPGEYKEQSWHSADPGQVIPFTDTMAHKGECTELFFRTCYGSRVGSYPVACTSVLKTDPPFQ